MKGRVCEGSEGDSMETAGLLPCTNNTPLSDMAVIFDLMVLDKNTMLFFFCSALVNRFSLLCLCLSFFLIDLFLLELLPVNGKKDMTSSKHCVSFKTFSD